MSSFRVARERVSIFHQAVSIGLSEGLQQSSAHVGQMTQDTSMLFASQNEQLELAMEQVRSMKAEANALKINAEAEAKKILADARQEADKIAEDAMKQAQKLKAEAIEMGYSEGLKKANDENAARKKSEAAQLEKMISDIRSERVRIIDSLKGEIVGAAMDIAARIIHVKLDESDEVFLGLINTELGKIMQSESVSVSLSREDYARYFSGIQDLRDVFGDRSLRVLENKSLNEGDCVIETDNEIVDCGISGQLKRIEHVLRNEEEATPSCGAD